MMTTEARRPLPKVADGLRAALEEIIRPSFKSSMSAIIEEKEQIARAALGRPDA
jgi:hypothetical protein